MCFSRVVIEINLKVFIVVFEFALIKQRIPLTLLHLHLSVNWGHEQFFHQRQLLLENEDCDSFEFCDEVLCPYKRM